MDTSDITVTAIDGITIEDMYWAAGYFDARGGYYIRKTNTQIVFTDKDEDVLLRFAGIVGRGWVRPLPPPKHSHCFAISAMRDVRHVTRVFRPLVHRAKLIADMDRVLATFGTGE